MPLLAVFTTVATRADARAMARVLIERGLAACVQIHPIESFFEWQGAVQQETEYRLLVKTTEARRAAVEAAVRELHGYQVPAIFSLPMEHVDLPFAEWAEAACSDRRR